MWVNSHVDFAQDAQSAGCVVFFSDVKDVCMFSLVLKVSHTSRAYDTNAQVRCNNNPRVVGLTSLASIQTSPRVHTHSRLCMDSEGISTTKRHRANDLCPRIHYPRYFQKDNNAHTWHAIVCDAAVQMPRKSYS